MKKLAIVLLSVVLGFVAPLAGIVGAAPFEVLGQDPIQERVAGWLAVALYVALCQLWLSRKRDGFRANWPMMVGLLGSLLIACVLLVQGGIFHNWPLFISGCIGSFAGLLLANRHGGREALKGRKLRVAAVGQTSAEQTGMKKRRAFVLLAFIPGGVFTTIVWLGSFVLYAFMCDANSPSVSFVAVRGAIFLCVVSYPVVWIVALALSVVALRRHWRKQYLVLLAASPVLVSTAPFILAMLV